VNVYTENTLLEIIGQLVNVARQDQDLEKARELVVYALDLRADTIPVLMLAAGVESQAGAYSAALLYIDRIKDLQPEGSTLAAELEGELAVQQGEVEQGLEIFQQAWAISRSSALGAKIHGAFTVLEQTDAANQFLQEWLSVSPEDSAANLLQGMALQQDNQNEEAIAAYEIAYSQEPDSLIALNNLAWLYQDTNPPLALELANRAADLYPANADVLDTYGWILFNQNGNDTTIAIQVLERALELAPDSAAIAEHLATARQ